MTGPTIGTPRRDASPHATVAAPAPRDGSSPRTRTRTGTGTGTGTERPRADCTADSAGGLTFDVRPAGGTAEPHGTHGPLAGAAMLLRLRGGSGPADTVRLPLIPVDGWGTLRAVLPSTLWLPEGRWDACLAVDGEEPRRLLPGIHDLRSLVHREPAGACEWLGVRIPYATKYGNLTSVRGCAGRTRRQDRCASPAG